MLLLKHLVRYMPPRRFFVWWGAALALFAGFDVLWCIDIGSFIPFTCYVSLYVFLLIAAGLFSLPALWGRRILQFVLLELTACLLVANLMYATTYYIPIPLESYLLAGNLSTIGPAVSDAFKWRYLVLPLIPVAALMLARPEKPHALTWRRRLPWLTGLGMCCLAGVFMIAGRGGFRARMELMNRNGLTAPVYTIFAAWAYDAITMTEPLTPERAVAVKRWKAEHGRLAPAPPMGGEIHGKVAFILVESLESWPIGMRVDGVEITPRLNRLVADTVNVIYFPNVVTQTRDGRSIDAQLLYLAGRLPLKTGVYSMKYPQLDYPTLPKALKERCGASAVLFSPDPQNMWNQEPIARAFGFDAVFSADNWKTTSAADRAPDGYIYDKPMVSRTFALADSLWHPGENMFMMWVTHTSHTPFVAPEGYMSPAAAPITVNKTLRNYVNTVAYADEAIGMILDYLRSRPDADSIVTVIAGDHEGLAAERPGIVKVAPWVSAGRFTPLIVAGAGGDADCQRRDRLIGQVDVYTTLLDLLLPSASYPWRGMGFSALSPSHPGAAATPSGEIVGDTVSDSIATHLREAFDVSDCLMRHSMVP